MEGPMIVLARRATMLALTGLLAISAVPTRAATVDVENVPSCATLVSGSVEDGSVASPWEELLDSQGALTGHRLVIRIGGEERRLLRGKRAFAAEAGAERLLIGERHDRGTRLSMLDVTRGCRLWDKELADLAYPRRRAVAGGVMEMTLHEPRSRGFREAVSLDLETGLTEALIDGECASNCDPSDGEVPPSAYGPAGAGVPVPNFSGGAWPKGKTLGFRWRSGASPPDWARGPVKSAAADVERTAFARSPRFVYRSSASNSVAYTGAMPSFCSGIACASRALPTTWGVWVRPHGTDFAWGTLRWCQKASSSGCFDIRRVMLHEFGHVTGLHHPESKGFHLQPHDTVMHAISPAKPKAASTRHAFGRCDVATLQELYDVPDNRTPISTCNEVVATLSLSSSKDSVARGSTVKLKAVLRVDDRAAYRQLRANPLNDRSVKLKYRRAGSGNAWSTAWMKALNQSGKYELSIAPTATWEFKATFPAPSDEGLGFSRSQTIKVKVQ